MENKIVLTDEDVQTIEKFIDIRNKGYYCSGNELVTFYNSVMPNKVRPTQCSSCLRKYISDLEGLLNRWKAQLEKESEAMENKEVKEEEKKDVSTNGRKKNDVGTKRNTKKVAS